jgi:hypothetical protein
MLLGALWFSSGAFACSGPDAEASIRRSEVIGWTGFGLSLALCIGLGLLVLRRKLRGKQSAILATILLLGSGIHPALWLSARTGDCGFGLLLLSGSLAAFELVLVLLTVHSINRGRRLVA